MSSFGSGFLFFLFGILLDVLVTVHFRRLNDVDLEFAQAHQDEVELVRVGQVGRQRLVEIVESEVALFLGQLDQFANPRLGVACRRRRRIAICAREFPVVTTDRGFARRPGGRFFPGRTTAAALRRRSLSRDWFARPAARSFGLRHDLCLARFLVGLGRAPSLFGLSRGGFGRLFGAAGSFRFLCQNDVLLSDRRNSRIRANLACLPRSQDSSARAGENREKSSSCPRRSTTCFSSAATSLSPRPGCCI